ncbi:MAG: flagellar assembly protein T N-terminal domain-containing protein [Syntrophorhabdaceae bacterium]|nr:flagellar assembly protein T N-terminal domain-containing protein [Syntrophorhabdaceae bacterium]
MKKIISLCLFITYSLFLFTPILSYSQEQYRDVQVKGSAPIKGSEDEAKKLAIKDALRQAVEMAVGTIIKSQTEMKDFETVKDEVTSNAEGFVKSYDILRESSKGGRYEVVLIAKVMTERISEAFKKRLDKASAALGKPSIAFVLTTWKKIGEKGESYTRTDQVDVSGRYKGQSSVDGSYDTSRSSDARFGASSRDSGSVRYDVSKSSSGAAEGQLSLSERGSAGVSATGRARATEDSVSVSGDASGYRTYDGKGSASYRTSSTKSGKGSYDVSQSQERQASFSGRDSGSVRARLDESSSQDASLKVTRATSSAKRLSETEWKKYPDPAIITAFQQEFKEKGFDPIGADKAREIVMAESLVKTSIDIFDRSAVRKEAEKEGANFVARGEAKIIDYEISPATGNIVARSQIDVEIIDVNSGDIVASYVNTSQASSTSRETAETQAIKAVAVLAARTLANQTLETWEKRATQGQFFTVEVHNYKSSRSQLRPILKTIESLAEIRNQTTDDNKKILRVQVSYKGARNKLGDAILTALEGMPGFSEKEFDGPYFEGGVIKYIFK